MLEGKGKGRGNGDEERGLYVWDDKLYTYKIVNSLKVILIQNFRILIKKIDNCEFNLLISQVRQE